MEELKIFSSSQFGDIRVQQIDGEPWFVAIDVCNALAVNYPEAKDIGVFPENFYKNKHKEKMNGT